MIKIPLPNPFNTSLLFQYLNRSADEITFQTEEEIIRKIFNINDVLILAEISFTQNDLLLEFPQIKPKSTDKTIIVDYLISWFDLKTDLNPFYKMAEKDSILSVLAKEFLGLRMVKAPDLFEAISWSIIGQQINLPFAYRCKKALVLKAGLKLEYDAKNFYTFPRPEVVLNISDTEFREMQFSSQKVKYIRGVAEEIIEGKLNQDTIAELPFDEAKNRLIELKGIGNWSANYVLMRCFSFKEAFPIEDVGLHNALKYQLALAKKPSIDEIKAMAKNWKGWEAYVTFYLWHSLL